MIWLRRLLATFFPRRADRRLEHEFAAHLSALEDEYRGQGMEPNEARLAAKRAFGPVQQLKEEYRGRRGFTALEQLGRDFSFGIRSLRRSPGFTAVALLSLAFGIGVNAAIFTLLNALVLTTLPVPHPERVVELQEFDIPVVRYDSFFSYPFYREISTRNTIFERVTAKADLGMIFDLRLPFGNKRVKGAYVSGTYFEFLHARPYLGRLLDTNDDGAVGAHRVCVLSYRLWRGDFGGNPAIVGGSIFINGKPVEVVGVTGPEFTGLTLQDPPDLEAPMSEVDYLAAAPLGIVLHRDVPYWSWLQIFAQLKPGIGEQRASAQFAALARRIAASFPQNAALAGIDQYRVKLAPRGFDEHAELSRPLVILMSTVGLVLLIACLNLANLLLVRGQDRSREIAMRVSLGASRWRVLRQLLIESVLLAASGGILGLVTAHALVKYLIRDFNEGKQQGLIAIAPDVHVLFFTFAAASAALLLFGAVPAWLASNVSPNESLRGIKGEVFAASGISHLRRGFIVLQVALTVVLLFGGSLFERSVRNLRTIDVAADPDHLVLADINLLSGTGKLYAPVSIWHNIGQRVRQLPGVMSIAYGFPSPLSGAMVLSSVQVPGKPRSTALQTFVGYASPGYFKALGIPLLGGRDFSAADREGAAPVAIVNQKFAQTYFPGQNPLGKQFRGGGYRDTPVTIIGVVRNLPRVQLAEHSKSMFYMPMLQGPRDRQELTVRVRGNPETFERQLADVIHQLVPYMPLQQFNTMAVQRDAHIAQQRMLALLSTLFGALGLALSAVGLYGLVSYSVARRTREIGIRMSVGATPFDVLRLFLREHLRLVLAGGVIGSSLALAGDRFVRGLLYGLPSTDFTSLYIAAGMLFVVALAATLLPAARATHVEPSEALRAE